MAIVGDSTAPAAVRNTCHLLMMAIERNDEWLVRDSLSALEEAARQSQYRLPES
jgi:hypothetical protein